MQSERRETPQNVILIGFMGVGKTSVGRLVARSLGFEFVDTDEQIVAAAGMPIPQIFSEQGEPAFRALEAEGLRRLAKSESCVISTGGGIVTVPGNIEALRAAGMVVWLDAGPEAIFERVSGNSDRPLLQTEDPLGTIRDLLAERRPLYESAADQCIKIADLSPDELSYGVSDSARVWFGAAR